MEVHLDNTIFLRSRIQSVLNITLAHDTEMSNDIDGGGPKHVVITIREGLGRRNDDGIASMDTKRIEVLHDQNQ